VVMPEPPPPPPEPNPDDVTVPRSPGVAAADPMSEAGRKVLRFHYQRMLRNEPGTRAGEDIEALHDMRVATRRMRAAFRVFAEYYEPDVRKALIKGLKNTGQALGHVRDLDVFLEGAATYRAMLDMAEQPAFDALMEHWRIEREAARQEMNAHLDSDAYQDFVAAMGSFVETAGAGAIQPEDGRIALVRHEAPRQIYDRYADLRRYETALADASIQMLHALRIDGKRLRYTLEFFRDALGAEGGDAIARVVGLQDHLGLLHDADVAADMLRVRRQSLLEEDPQPRSGDLTAQLRALDGYLLDRETIREDLRRSFPVAWRSVTSPGMRRLLARAVSVL
jgi:CHAD domain-containing protein